MLDRAVHTDVPLLSADCVAPAWKTREPLDTSVEILRIVWEEVSWLPRPATFWEASMMREDDRLAGLREAIDLWRHKLAVGDLHDWPDIRADVRRSVEYFRKRPWASKVARLITYVAVPIGVAEALSGAVGVGLTVGAVGAASQCIADLVNRHRSHHWMSMGRDFIVRGRDGSSPVRPFGQ
jgi:hypothetical protein